MFSRHSFAIVGLAIAALISARPAGAQVRHLFESKAHYSGPIANEIASFNDDSYVSSLSFSADGKELAANFSQQLSIRVWRWAPPSRLVRTVQKPQDTASALWDILNFSPDGQVFAAAYQWSGASMGGSYARVWNTKTWQIEHEFLEPTFGVEFAGKVFSKDGKNLVSAQRRASHRQGDPSINEIGIYATNSWERVGSIGISPLVPVAIVLSRDDRYAAVSGWVPSPNNTDQSKVVIANLTERSIVRTIVPFPPQMRLEQLSWSVDGLRVAVSGMPFLAGGELKDSEVRVFDVATGELVSADGSTQNSHVTGLFYTSDGKYLIECGLNQTVRIWDAAQKTLLQIIPINANAAAVSNDGHYLALAEERRVGIWELK
jgi:WD40 repeat protein